MFIHWDRKLEIGDTMIDTEHRMLIMLFKKLDIAIKTGQSPDAIRLVIVEVKKFAEFHFASEENLMREVGYPEFARHEAIHSGLLSQLEVLISRIFYRREYPDDLLFFLNSWTITHIGREDKKLSDFVAKSEARPMAESVYAQFLR